MSFPTTNESFEFTPLDLTLLEDCTEESVYAPGYVQPFGVLIILQEPGLAIVQVSQNVEDWFGISAEALLGQPLQRLLSPPDIQAIRELLAHDSLESGNSLELHITSPSQQPQQVRASLRRTGEALMLELEPSPCSTNTSILRLHQQLQSSILKLRDTQHGMELAQVLATEVRALTGFDHVMIYRFEADDHGVVIAEERAPHAESFLGLHFPATDIPLPARTLFSRNWVRHIPDVNAVPAPLVPTQKPLSDRPQDLRASVLRGVSPYHIEYLQNMGVAGSLTISLIDDKRLWGLIACHHYSPRWVNDDTRRICELIGQFASVELVHQQARELDAYRNQVKAIQNDLQHAFLQEPNFIHQVLARKATDLLSLVHASGVAIALNHQFTLVGQTPPLPVVQELVAWLPTRNQHEFYFTDCLSHPYPPAAAYKDTASGLLAISIVLQQTSYHLLWFRPEQVQTVNWAGSPQDTVAVDEQGKLRLCPRKSFALWKETVQSQSLPWQSAEIEAALMMRNTLMLAVLEFSQRALEQAAERAAIASRAKSQFLAKMSHELRTPLNAILGFTQVMNRTPDISDEFREYLTIIGNSGAHLLELINDVLEMSRIEAGQVVLDERSFNLHRLLKDLHDLFALRATQNGLLLTFEQAPDLPRYIYGDERKLRQILINLINNAIKFTARGSITIRAWAEPSKHSTQQGCTCHSANLPAGLNFMLFFSIEDTGCGIKASDWESIFEAFMQTESGRHAEGTGLGLSISRQFARLMGGNITVQSTPGQGSTFTVQVLSHQPDTKDFLKPETDRTVIGLAEGQATYRILVAEDVLENRQLLATILTPIGFDVVTAENGEAAIAQWQRWKPHLILMDIQIPIVDGYEVTRRIRAQEQEHPAPPAEMRPQHRTKIIAFTAYTFESDRAASLEAGCDGYLATPFTESALLETIAHHLELQYQYDDTSLAMVRTERDALSPEDLAIMPASWRVQVHEAALDLKDDVLRQLIAQIPPQSTSLVQGLTLLVDNFQLEAIAALTKA